MASSERENELCSENCGKCEKLDLTWHSPFGLTMHVHSHIQAHMAHACMHGTHTYTAHAHTHVCGTVVATCVSRFQLFFFIQDLGLCVSHIVFAASHSLSCFHSVSLSPTLSLSLPLLFLLSHSFPLSLISCDT